jgi:hypothetical protein
MKEAIPLGPGAGNEQFKYNSEQKKYLTEKNGVFYGGDYLPELPEEIIIPGTEVETNASGAPKQSYREIGAANRAVFNEKIEKKKTWLSGLFSRFGSKVKDTKESVVDHAFAAPRMAADGYEAVDKGIQKMEDKIVFGSEVAGRAAELAGAYAAYKAKEGMASANKFIDNRIVNPIDAKVQKLDAYVDKKWEQGKNYAELKKQQGAAWMKDKAETAAAIAALGVIKTLDGAQAIKQGAQEKIGLAKEKVSQGYENVLGMGAAAIASAEQKRKSLFSAARDKWNQIQLGFLNRQLANERAKAEMAREELEAREAKAKLIEQKMALLNTDFVGNAQEATA